MRIGIIGAHGVGKTTIAKYISQKYNVTLITEQIRYAVRMFSALNYKTPDEMVGTEWYTHMVIETLKRQINNEKNNQNGFVSDRTLLDYYIYYECLNKDEDWIITFLKNNIIEYYRNKYDLVIYIPIMIPLACDGYRNTDDIFRKKIDKNINNYLFENKNVYCMTEADKDCRFLELTNIINPYYQYDKI
jgi:nicotinamide riboside kinase